MLSCFYVRFARIIFSECHSKDCGNTCRLLVLCKHPVTLHPCSYATGECSSMWLSCFCFFIHYVLTVETEREFGRSAVSYSRLMVLSLSGPAVRSSVLCIQSPSLTPNLCQNSQEVLYGETFKYHLVPLPDLMAIALSNSF